MTRRVYFAQSATSLLIKIGVSHDVAKRLDGLRQSGAGPLTLLGTVPGGHMAESEWHHAFRGDRVTGEWYRPSPVLLQAIVQAVAQQSPILPATVRQRPAPLCQTRLFELAAARGWSDRDLAQQLHVSQSTVWRWRCLGIAPTPHTMFFAAALFGCGVADLWWQEQAPEPERAAVAV